MDSYRCDKYISKDTKAAAISDTVEYRHEYLTTPSVTPEDQIMLSINKLTAAIEGTNTTKFDAQMQAITALQDMYTKSKSTTRETDRGISNPPEKDMSVKPSVNDPPTIVKPAQPSPRVPVIKIPPALSPGVRKPDQPVDRQEQDTAPIARRTRLQVKQAQESKRVPPTKVTSQPIAARTRARLRQVMTITPAQAASRYFPKELLAMWCTPVTDLAMPVMDPDTGKTYKYR